VRQQMEETIDKEYQNDKEIFSYEGIRGFYQRFLEKHRAKYLRKLDKLDIESKIEAVREMAEEPRRLAVTQIFIEEGFEIETNPDELSEALEDEALWNHYMQKNSELPEHRIFLEDLDDFLLAFSEEDTSAEELAGDITDYVTRTKDSLEGDRYEAKCNSESIFVTLVEKTYESAETVGWKCHISIHPESSNIEQAWNIVKDILIEHEVSSFKIVAPTKKLDDERAGCEITIYQFENPEKHWLHILRMIEQALIEHDIEPRKSHGEDKYHDVDKRLTGSNYITYRNDAFEGKYISARQVKKQFPNEKERWYNPSGANDPFEGFDVSPKPQERLEL